MKKLKVGIIGLGVGEKHIAAYLSHPACEVVTLCDFSPEKLAEVGARHPGIELTVNADELLQDLEIDVVSIASYDNYHYQQIVQAIKAGKHVFVEKPICLYESEAREIRQLLSKNPSIKISSNLNLRTAPRFRRLKQMIAGGEMGQPYYVEGDYNYGRLNKITEGWRGKMDFYSVVYGGGVHVIDLLLWLTNEKVVEVAAYGNNISSREAGFANYDTVVSMLKFGNGMVGKVTANFSCVFPHFHTLNIYGTKATFINSLKNAALYTSRDPADPAEEITEAYPGEQNGEIIRSFIDFIANDSPPEVAADDIFRAMSVCFAIEKAAHQSGPVAVKYI
jgi:predicted dehydrogenase